VEKKHRHGVWGKQPMWKLPLCFLERWADVLSGFQEQRGGMGKSLDSVLIHSNSRKDLPRWKKNESGFFFILLGFQAFAGLDPWSLGGHRITESESCRGYERPFRPGFSLAEEGLRYRTLEGWPGLVSFRKSQRNVSSAKDCREGLKLPSRAPIFPSSVNKDH
jgi:hypothetical protein